MAMTYDAFLNQMKKDLDAGFAENLPAKYSQVRIGIREVEKLLGESYRGISFRVGYAPIEGNLNMQQAYQAHEAGVPYESILRDTQETVMQQVVEKENVRYLESPLLRDSERWNVKKFEELFLSKAVSTPLW